MKLGPKQVRFLRPFWPAPFGRSLRFIGRRNTIHLQETALVVEGEILRFHYLGLERLLARALSEWTTVTIPYSRIASVRFRPQIALRLVIALAIVALSTLVMSWPWAKPGEWTTLDAIADALIAVPVLFLAVLVWWGIRTSYVLVFRSKDGTRLRLCFSIRTRAERKWFTDALQSYRDAARTYAAGKVGK